MGEVDIDAGDNDLCDSHDQNAEVITLPLVRLPTGIWTPFEPLGNSFILGFMANSKSLQSEAIYAFQLGNMPGTSN